MTSCDLADRTTKGRNWVVESRNHIAGMSPVITKAPPSGRRVMVVSHVFNIMVVKARPAAGSPMTSDTLVA